MTNAEAWFNNSLRPRKPEGSLGRTPMDGHLDSHTAPELCYNDKKEGGSCKKKGKRVRFKEDHQECTVTRRAVS